MLERIDRQAGKRFIYSAFGVILLIFWLVFAFGLRPGLQETLKERTELALVNNGVSIPIEVAFKGRHGTIRGMAPGLDARNELERILGLIEVPGASRIDLEVGTLPDTPPQELPWVELAYQAEAVLAKGVLPQSAKSLVASRLGGRPVELGEMKFEKHVVGEEWVSRISDLDHAADGYLYAGEIKVREATVEATGTFASTEARDQFSAALVAFAGVNLEPVTDFSIIAPPAVPELVLKIDGGNIEVESGRLPDTTVVKQLMAALVRKGVKGVEKLILGTRVQSPRWLNTGDAWLMALAAHMQSGVLIVRGRNLTIQGEPIEDRRADLVALLEDMRAQKFVSIDDTLSTPAVAPMLDPALVMNWGPNSDVEISGQLAGGEAGEKLIASLQSAFPEADLGSLVVQDGVQSAAWVDEAEKWIPVVSSLVSADVEASADLLRISGEAFGVKERALLDPAEDALQALGVEVALSIDVPGPEPIVAINGNKGMEEGIEPVKPEIEVVVPDLTETIAPVLPDSITPIPPIEDSEMTAPVSDLPKGLVQLEGFGDPEFVFEGESAQLSDAETKKVEGLADSLVAAQIRTPITVAGFAGEETSGYTRWLSQRRADEVWRLLIAYGVDVEMLTVGVFTPDERLELSSGHEQRVMVFSPKIPRAVASGGGKEEEIDTPPVEVSEIEASNAADLPEKEEAKAKGQGGDLVGTIYFGHGTAMIKAAQRDGMKPIAAKLKSFPAGTKFVAAGFADPSGNTEFNEWLSGERAKSVREMMSSAGVSSKQVETRVYGASELKGNADTEEGQALNRRVEIRTWYEDS